VAAPVFDAGGVPVAVISVCGPIDRFETRREHATRLLVEETRVLSAQSHRGAPFAF